MNHRQEHLCTIVCAAPGICEIETAPYSIEATFNGRNETFQYTKVCCPLSDVGSGTDLFYSIRKVRWCACTPPRTDLKMLVAKRLKCVKLIPPNAMEHGGPHTHSPDTNVIHFCEAKYGCPI